MSNRTIIPSPIDPPSRPELPAVNQNLNPPVASNITELTTPINSLVTQFVSDYQLIPPNLRKNTHSRDIVEGLVGGEVVRTLSRAIALDGKDQLGYEAATLEMEALLAYRNLLSNHKP